MSTVKDLQNAFKEALEATQALPNRMVNGMTKVAHENAPRGASVTIQPTGSGVVVRMGRPPGRAAAAGVADRAVVALSAEAKKIAVDVVGGAFE